MNKNNVILGILVVVGVVAIGAGIVLKNEKPAPPPEDAPAVDAASEPAPAAEDPEIAEKVAALEDEKQALENTLAQTRRELTTLMNDVDAAEQDVEEEEPPNFMEALANMMDSPEMQDMMKVQQRMALDQTHGELFKGLDLDAETLDKLKDLMVEKQMLGMTAGLAMMNKKEKEPVVQVDIGSQVEAIDEKIAALLGEEGHDQFTQFEETQMERMQVDFLKERLSGDLAMDWDQQHALILALAEARESVTGDDFSFNDMQHATDPAKMREAMGFMDQVYDGYLESAGDVLNDEQLAVFEESINQWKVMQQAGMKMAESMFGESLTGEDEE